jgi:hypothetical protein
MTVTDVTLWPVNNPSPFAGFTPPAHVPASKRFLLVHTAQWCVLNTNRFVYTEGPQRSQMFHIPLDKLDLAPVIHGDCSQWYASLAHGCGAKGLTDTDYTGTLLEKGKPVARPRAGDCVIFGPGTGTHAAAVTFNGYTIGFGHQGGPNRVKLTDMVAWFAAHGHPGVRFLSFL